MSFDPDRDSITPEPQEDRPPGPVARFGLHGLRGLCGLGFVLCAFLVVGLTVNVVVALVTSPFGLEGVRARIDSATANLGPGDTLLGVEASALVPVVAVVIYAAAVVGLWLFPGLGAHLRRRLASGEEKEGPR